MESSGSSLLNLLQQQKQAYPAMEFQDCVKLLYQRFLGSEHFKPEPARCMALLREEKALVGSCPTEPAYEKIGENVCRFNLRPVSSDEETLQTLTQLFLLGIPGLSGQADACKQAFLSALEQCLSWILQGKLPFSYEDAYAFFTDYKKQGFPALHHSAAYREAYHPSYRLLYTEYARCFPVFVAINRLFQRKKHVVLAIDGKCGAGKSTLATLLAGVYSANVLHMDDFYLPADLRTLNRLQKPGGNIHYERFSEEVLPVLKGLQKEQPLPLPASYRIFSCSTMDYKKDPGILSDRPLTIVEGSYSLRPEFREAYDLTVFLDISPKLQKERLLSRNGEEAYKNFESKWIPMELSYFEHYHIRSLCDLIL